jgi:hypothetical protein
MPAPVVDRLRSPNRSAGTDPFEDFNLAGSPPSLTAPRSTRPTGLAAECDSASNMMPIA